MKRMKFIVLIISSISLTSCVFTPDAYNSSSSYRSGSSSSSNSNYNTYISGYSYSNSGTTYDSSYGSVINMPNYTSSFSQTSISGDIAHSLIEMAYFVSEAITKRATQVSIYCDFTYSISAYDFVSNYVDNRQLVSISTDKSQLSGTQNYLSKNTFNIKYLAYYPDYSSSESGSNTYKGLNNMSYYIRLNSSTHYSSSLLPIDSLNVPTLDVYDSEGLWWALQNGMRPNPKNEHTYSLYQKAREQVASICLKNNDAYNNARLIYEYLTSQISYDYDCLTDSTTSTSNYRQKSYALEGVIDRKRAVCDGISKAFVLFCGLLGIRTVRAYGYPNSTSSGHAWNYILLNGNWYLVCATWGQENVSGLSISGKYSVTDYSPFLTTYNYFTKNGGYYNCYNTSVGNSATTAFPYDSCQSDILDYNIDCLIDSVSELSSIFSKYRSVSPTKTLDKAYLVCRDGRVNVNQTLVNNALEPFGGSSTYNVTLKQSYISSNTITKIIITMK